MSKRINCLERLEKNSKKKIWPCPEPTVGKLISLDTSDNLQVPSPHIEHIRPYLLGDPTPDASSSLNNPLVPQSVKQNESISSLDHPMSLIHLVTI